METMLIEILNPKAKRLMQDLADMNLINIQKKSLASFTTILKKLRKKIGQTKIITIKEYLSQHTS